MSTEVAAAAMFGKIAVHNKLITQQQWDECFAFHQRTGGEVPVDEILVQKGYLGQKHADAIKKKLAEVEAKKAAPAPAPAAPSMVKAVDPGGLKPAAPPAAAGKPGFKPLAQPDPPAGRLADAGGDDEAAADEAKSDGGIPMSDDDAPALAASASAADFDDDEAPKSEPAAKPPAAAPAPAAAAGGTVAGGTVAGGHPRIPSPVPPNKVDPVALQLLKDAFKIGASDVHMASGSPPFFRLHGSLTFTKSPPLTADQARKMVLGFMDDAQQQHWLRTHDLDFSWQHKDIGRFRVNALEQFRGPDIVFRCIPNKVPSLAQLGLPESLEKFTEWHQGLVLITGPAGSGKSTTAAALIDLINTKRKDHVITVEDPVEFLQPSKGCNVTQRQVPSHTNTFASALRAALREDPDIIMIGEMRDLETVSLAIRAAETGHLVIGTLQTKNAPRTIDRVVDVFPSDQQAQIRTMLSESLRGIISQVLVPTADGKGRVAALEIMFITGAISNLIRDSRTFQLHSVMETGKKAGHRLMDESLMELVAAGRITKEEAVKASENPKKFR